MATIAQLGATTFNTTAGSKTVTVAPALDDVIVVVAACSGLAGGTTGVSDNNSGGAGAYTKVTSDAVGFSTTGFLNVWIRNTKIASATSTVFTAAQVGSTGGGLMVFAVKDMNATGNSGRRTNGFQSTIASGTPAPVMSLPPLPQNPIISACCDGTNSSPVAVERTGYTAVSANYNTPATNLTVCFVNSGESSNTITWGGAASGQFASVAVELDTQVPLRGIVNFQDPGVF